MNITTNQANRLNYLSALRALDQASKVTVTGDTAAPELVGREFYVDTRSNRQAVRISAAARPGQVAEDRSVAIPGPTHVVYSREKQLVSFQTRDRVITFKVAA